MWVERAACGGHDDPDSFFYGSRDELRRVAHVWCGQCPVAAECARYAVTVGATHGVWGGKVLRSMQMPPGAVRAWLAEYLADGLEHEIREARNAARRAGVNQYTLSTAARELGIIRQPRTWQLPRG